LQELAVLRLLVRGLANKSIAHELGITDHTVKAHITRLFRKTGVSNGVELTARAISLGIVEPPLAD
jgi:DNA-binding NarL/FixJ family response regulator